MPSYEFESLEPKMVCRNRVGIGFAGSSLYADIIERTVTKEKLEDFDKIVENISKKIKNERKNNINNEIKRRTGVDPDDFYTNPSLPIPEGVRSRIYRLMKRKIVDCRCLVAGFDEENKARLTVINHEGDSVDATNFNRISIGSGMPFSTIYFDQFDYNADIELKEALIFSFEAKKWAEAPTGVGSKTDIILLRKIDQTESLLKAKTVKELKKIARNKDLSNFSNLRKNEL
ncbi:hypothetical protein AKJ62_00735 [candidate division MSBL1 archaeon SCGC-AAA259D14]|nr:hypothetical protein AKJ62_00735 [candidate division MSBL1 archaeon SCGC-AAA259D14]